MRKFLLLLILLLLSCTQSSKTISISQFEQRIWELTNQERIAHNLSPLLYDEGLADLARMHSSNMFKYDFFAHKDHLGYLVDDRKRRYYPQLIVASIGENLAKIVSGAKIFTPEEIVEGWMNSTEHRENILNGSFTHLGVGVFTQGSVLYATQNFGTPIAKLLSQIPEQLEVKNKYQLQFEFMSLEPVNELEAILNFPESNFKYNIDDQYYTLGLKPIPIHWITDKQFEVTIDFPAGKGDYNLCFGFNRSYFADGIKLKVK